MPKNPFKINKDYQNKPNRNAFDLSKSNNLTFNFGELIPCYCRETLPGDTFEINSAMGLRFMPLAFPIQTKCRAYVHFFYQRVKNLWPDFYDFINGNDKLMGNRLIPPYLKKGSATLQQNLFTGSLGDYLGLPTVSFNNLVPSNGSLRLNFWPNFLNSYAAKFQNPPKLPALFLDEGEDTFLYHPDPSPYLHHVSAPDLESNATQFESSNQTTRGRSWQFIPLLFENKAVLDSFLYFLIRLAISEIG